MPKSTPKSKLRPEIALALEKQRQSDAEKKQKTKKSRERRKKLSENQIVVKKKDLKAKKAVSAGKSIPDSFELPVKGINLDDLRIIDHLLRVGFRFHIQSLNDFVNDRPGEYERSWKHKIKPGRTSELFVVKKFITEHKDGISELKRIKVKYFPNDQYALPSENGTVANELLMIAEDVVRDAEESKRFNQVTTRATQSARKLAKNLK